MLQTAVVLHIMALLTLIRSSPLRDCDSMKPDSNCHVPGESNENKRVILDLVPNHTGWRYETEEEMHTGRSHWDVSRNPDRNEEKEEVEGTINRVREVLDPLVANIKDLARRVVPRREVVVFDTEAGRKTDVDEKAHWTHVVDRESFEIVATPPVQKSWIVQESMHQKATVAATVQESGPFPERNSRKEVAPLIRRAHLRIED